MRHRKSIKKLGLSTRSHRKAMLSNMASSLIVHKRIKVTHARAKALRRFIEPLITFAKRGDVHARRQVLRNIKHKDIVHSLFHDIAPVYAERPGGYTRITKLGFRDNDRAAISMIELVDMEGVGVVVEKPKEKKEKKESND
ncbi:MAG: 50S ribosomal protein L17 [Candidatus Marinimicrobia bacterium]|nr:50S ribosomal protein L17 [Candidatus Neomarinimicrobiota bacterium]